MDFAILHEREEQSVPGDFYVESKCCVSCGVPQAAAPDLVGWTNDQSTQCYWKKQPETPGEMEQAFAVFDGQELGCHRYAGHDPVIQARVGRESCDFPIEDPTERTRSNEPICFWTEPTFFERIKAKFRMRS